MAAALLKFISGFMRLSWLTGAIFEKELRVASRRRRNYLLRFSYVSLLTVILSIVWLAVVEYTGSGLQVITRMSSAGQMIIVFIVWFQFCACQIIAGVMLSTSISDEIYHKTLGLLMTTPINSFQIVMGKLLSKLLQLLILLGISLPLLAVVRIFGGVPWDYIISSLSITLTTVLFVGSLSLFFSIFNRRAYIVIILTILTMVALFALLPFLTAWIWYIYTGRGPGRFLVGTILVPNPYFNLFYNTIATIEPRSMAGAPFAYWPLHCGLMLTGSALILLLSVIFVRKVALHQMTGQLIFTPRQSRSSKKPPRKATGQRISAGIIRRVNGPPVLWKELRLPILGRHRIINFLGIVLGTALLLFTYALCALENSLDDQDVHLVYTFIFTGLGVLLTIVLPATNITTEKESRSWPLLLTTTLNNWQILLGKFFGNLRRLVPVWGILFAHLFIFSLFQIIHPIAILQTGILVTWIVMFLSCSGLYFSSCFKRTTTAVVMNFVLAAALWALIPILLACIVEFTDSPDDFVESYLDTNPFVHIVVIMDAATDRWNVSKNYNWVGFRNLNAIESTLWMYCCMLGYTFLGLIFAWRAGSRFRRNIF